MGALSGTFVACRSTWSQSWLSSLWIKAGFGYSLKGNNTKKHPAEGAAMLASGDFLGGGILCGDSRRRHGQLDNSLLQHGLFSGRFLSDEPGSLFGTQMFVACRALAAPSAVLEMNLQLDAPDVGQS